MTRAVEVEAFDREMKTTYCIDMDTRDRQVAETMGRRLPALEAVPDHDRRIAVVCYGPSLEETWGEIKGFDAIITCSGAHKFLIDRGVIPTYHCEVDPREHKAALIGEPHKDVQYLVASVCHNAVFDLLEGYNVRVWHVFSHEAERTGVPVSYPRGEWAITGGSNVGLRAMVLARFLGYKKMTVFGMDYSFKRDGTQHAGWHPKEIQNIHAVEVGGGMFYTNPAMHQYAQQFFSEVQKIGQIELDVVGNGLLQTQIREHLKKGPLIPATAKPALIAAATPATASQAYIELNRKLHEENPHYGTSGSKRADVVRKLIAATKPATILDYGCGKGTLGQALAIPIWEYDPAIPGKEAPPRPADLVICSDVLEHIEPDYLKAVLLDLSRCTLKVCYALVHTGPALKTLPDGRNTHLIQKPSGWWRETLEEFFSVAKLEESGPEITFILGPRKKEERKIAPALDFSDRTTPVRLNGTEVRFYTPNEITQWRAKSLLVKEPVTIEWLSGFAKGEVLYDVGANVGGYTILAARHSGVKVISFEPEAENYAILCRNILLNEADAVAYCVALTDEHRADRIYLSSHEAGNSCNSFGMEVGPGLKSRPGIVQGAIGERLDDLAAFLPSPDYLKVDVDGLEHKVLAGARRLLESGQLKSLLVEVNENLPEHRAMIETLQGLGYTFDQAQVDAARRQDGPFKGCAEYVFRRPNSVEDYVCARIRDAEIRKEPYPHLYLEEIFPEAFYAELIAALPANGYISLEEARGTAGYPQRSVADAPKCVAWMRSGKLRSVLNAKFSVKATSDETLLIRDVVGYAIGPHTDTPGKAVSALFYLPRHWTEQEHGTSIYVPLIKCFRDPDGRHHEREGFRVAWTAPGKPNSVFAFARTDNSFHGAEPYQGSGARDILLYDTRKA